MASLENKLLQAWIAPTLKAVGFTKLGATWHRAKPPFIQVLNIQGSQWSRNFYFNLGIYITEMGDSDKPRENHCHVRGRLDGFIPNRERFHQLCDFENDLSGEQRHTEIEAIIALYALPWLDQFGSKEQLQQYIQRNNKDAKALISVDAFEYLGIPIDNS